MLSSLTRHFNESVFRGPDMEGGADGGEVEPEVGGGEDLGHDEGGGEETHDEPLTVREQIKKSIAEASEDAAKPKEKKPSGRFGDRKPAAAAPAVEAKPAEPVSTTPAPTSLPKEAAAEWAKTPVAIQNAFIKREQDMAQGVAELKSRYALIDQAIAPHTDALRQMNATPQEAVNRMFLWFKALAGRPTEAFPALAQSMGIDWSKLNSPQAQPGDQAAAQGAASGGPPTIPEEVKQYVGRLEGQVQQLVGYVQNLGGQLGGIQNNFNAQNEAKTRENVNIWSQGKKYFEDVRQDMAQLIEKGIIPLKDGQVDLDTAYERAIYFNPEVRAKVLAEQEQANQQVQQEAQVAATTAQQAQVGKARKASVSLPANSTPGASNGPVGSKKQKQGRMSVRDSLKAALSELRDQ